MREQADCLDLVNEALVPFESELIVKIYHGGGLNLLKNIGSNCCALPSGSNNAPSLPTGYTLFRL